MNGRVEERKEGAYRSIISLLSKGFSISEIAALTYMPPESCRRFYQELLNKMDARDNDEIVAAARRKGLV